MKKTVLFLLAILTIADVRAQIFTDTVHTGASYANQVWYSLSADEQGTAPKNNWDLAFSVSGFGSTIQINSVIGTMLWNYPKSAASGYASVDTSGLSTWMPRYNSDTSWALGAMGRYADPANPSDLDWGVYNVTTHIVTGDSLYIIKLASGVYKKLLIENLSSGVYHFKYANLDGTDAQTASIDKTAYTGKNFVYYSIQSNSIVDREPLSANWDLLFTQYTTFIPTAYTVAGILANDGVQVAKCTDVPDKTTFTDHASATFISPINTIGYNWKSFTGSGYSIKDSLVFFVKPLSGDIWKLILTGFSGSATGSTMFTKEKIYTYVPTAIAGGTNSNAGISMVLYPNPSVEQQVTVVYSIEDISLPVVISVTDMAGKVLLKEQVGAAVGLQQYMLPSSLLLPGMYIVHITAGNSISQQQLVIQ